jgi:hypothetical protein
MKISPPSGPGPLPPGLQPLPAPSLQGRYFTRDNLEFYLSEITILIRLFSDSWKLRIRRFPIYDGGDWEENVITLSFIKFELRQSNVGRKEVIRPGKVR